jgi:hypothetical protein
MWVCIFRGREQVPDTGDESRQLPREFGPAGGSISEIQLFLGDEITRTQPSARAA